MKTTIALFASSRRHGNTGTLLDRVAAELSIEVVDLGTRVISPYDYEHRNRDDDFEPLIKRVLEFEQIIFASPVYWYAVAPAMKVFLDRISDLLDVPDLQTLGRALRGKTAYVLCTSIYAEIPAPFFGAFRETFQYLGMNFGGYLHANCANGFSAGDHDEEIRNFIRQVGRV